MHARDRTERLSYEDVEGSLVDDVGLDRDLEATYRKGDIRQKAISPVRGAVSSDEGDSQVSTTSSFVHNVPDFLVYRDERGARVEDAF